MKIASVVNLLEKTLGAPKQKRDAPNPVDLLVATLLSQNTNDHNSHRAYANLKRIFPTWEDALGASTKKIASAIRVGGMAAQKSKRIKEILHTIRDRYGSIDLTSLRRMEISQAMDELQTLKGVGKKTAACVILFSFRKPVFPVDTHIHRILNRVGIVRTKTPEKTFDAMQSLVPPQKMYSLHTNLIRFGRMVCKAQNPLCGACVLYDLCEYQDKEKFALSRESKKGDSEKVHFMLLDNV